MTTEQILALGRVAERALICGFAGISLILGWNLFRVGVVSNQSADFNTKGWKANLKRVGPGVFFALFGSSVLAIALRSPLELQPARTEGISGQANKYLYALPVEIIDGVDIEYRNHAISPQEAYERLRKALKDASDRSAKTPSKN